MKRVLFISGSTKALSVNRQLLTEAGKRLGADVHCEMYDIASLPHFNPDLDVDPAPAQVIQFRKAVEESAGVIICTPEYVFSLPGVLKNAVEWLVSTVLFTGKITALITASSSGHKAHESLQLVMKTVGAEIPENCALMISGVKSKMSSAGEITDAATRQQLDQLVNSFVLALGKEGVAT